MLVAPKLCDFIQHSYHGIRSVQPAQC